MKFVQKLKATLLRIGKKGPPTRKLRRKVVSDEPVAVPPKHRPSFGNAKNSRATVSGKSNSVR